MTMTTATNNSTSGEQFSSITPRLYKIGKALLGEDTLGNAIGLYEKTAIINGATIYELIAAKAIIERYHPTNLYAIARCKAALNVYTY
jgi:hypothetical protein